MCLFTFPNKSALKARKKGVERFECGGCPECLQKKSRLWALRAAMEAKQTPGMMITLTYDTYKYNDKGVIIGENPVDATIPLSKPHAQRFIKRLRKYLKGKKVKYIITAERGKRTGRAHFHALIFGHVFDDLVRYKKSKRGNIIYKSKTLDNIWSGDKEHSGGICTVDCINIGAATARYCTKYCAKDSGVNDTFMLFSRGIGEKELIKRFNGLSYWVDGREYSIPRTIWQKVIERKYNISGYSKYVNEVKLFDFEKMICGKLDKLDVVESIAAKNGDISLLADCSRKRDDIWKRYEFTLGNPTLARDRQAIRREIYANFRDNDYLYKRYLAYWKHKNDVANISRPDDFSRILALPDNKYRGYKAKAIHAKNIQNTYIGGVRRNCYAIDFIPPRTNCQGFVRFPVKKEHVEKSFAPLSRHYRANDTITLFNYSQKHKYDKNRITFMPLYEDFNPFESPQPLISS